MSVISRQGIYFMRKVRYRYQIKIHIRLHANLISQAYRGKSRYGVKLLYVFNEISDIADRWYLIYDGADKFVKLLLPSANSVQHHPAQGHGLGKGHLINLRGQQMINDREEEEEEVLSSWHLFNFCVYTFINN